MMLALLIGLGLNELLVILVIVLVLFGASRVPQLMRGLGQGIREFKGAVNEDDRDGSATAEAEPPSPPAEKED